MLGGDLCSGYHVVHKGDLVSLLSQKGNFIPSLSQNGTFGQVCDAAGRLRYRRKTAEKFRKYMVGTAFASIPALLSEMRDKSKCGLPKATGLTGRKNQ